MDERRARILDDLRGLVGGDLLFDPVGRSPYAQDAGPLEADPLGVVVPRSTADLVALVRYAVDQSIALHPRGAGTGSGGDCLGPGLVVDLARHFRRIVAIGPATITAQAGVVIDTLNAQLAPLGRRLACDPPGTEAATVGGLVATNGSGPRSVATGAVADLVERLGVVFAHGEVAELGCEPRPTALAIAEEEDTTFVGHLARRVAALMARHADLVARLPSPSGAAGGCVVRDVLTADRVRLSRLLAGSQGTLAIVTEATLRTEPIPASQRVVLLPFARLEDAARAAAAAMAAGPSSAELVDWRALRLAREADPLCRDWIDESAEAALILEFSGDEVDGPADRARRLIGHLRRGGGLAGPATEAIRRADCERLLGLRAATRPQLMRLKGRRRAQAVLDGLFVPTAAWPEFLRRAQAGLRHRERDWSLRGEPGTGRLEIRPFLDPADPADAGLVGPLAAELFEAACDCGGGLSTASGLGVLPAGSAVRRLGELAPLYREIKALFDPIGLLNPGRGGAGDDLGGPSPSLRSHPSPPAATPATTPLATLRWLDRPAEGHASACNGCGACRSLESGLRMCPTFRATRSEGAAPRAHAGLFRRVAAGVVDPKLWGSEEVKRAAELCVHCRLCDDECPAGVDVSGLMLEAKAAYVENHGLAPSDWVFSRIETWSKLASRFPRSTNALMASPAARWALERLTGLSRLRRLPRAHRTPFVRRAERLGLARPKPTEPGPRVAYFVDVVANYFDQELGEAAVAVLRHAGVNVYVPSRQRGCGMPALVAGDLQTARDQAAANLRVLGDAVRDGYTVVCTEPTAALMLRREYLRLTDDLDAELVAQNTMDLGQYLAGLGARGLLPRPELPLRARVGYHQPCHLRALGAGTPGLDLIRSIPELEVEFIDRGCSGIAGTFGLAERNFRTSLRAGRGLLSRLGEADLEIGSTECGACRMQMEQGSPKRTHHPIKLLSLAYGLNPDQRQRFREPKPRRLIFD